MTRLPYGCSVEWAKYPARQERFLAWLENHPHERQCLFDSPNAERQISKTTCINMAALDIFARDEVPANSIGVKTDAKPFGVAILSLIKTRWRVKYQRINLAIGQAAARLEYEDFDSISKKIIEVESIKFPLWTRLHKIWRLLPEYNQFADRSESPVVRTPGRRRKRRRSIEVEPEEDSHSDYNPADDDAEFCRPPLPTRVKIGPPGPKTKRQKRFSTVSGTSTLVKTEHGDPIIIDLEDDDEAGPSLSGSTSSVGVNRLTRDQQFEKEMAEIKLKTKEQERRAKEQEYKALEKKHEAFMALYGSLKL